MAVCLRMINKHTLHWIQQRRGVRGNVIQVGSYIKPVYHVVRIPLPWHPANDPRKCGKTLIRLKTFTSGQHLSVH